jgi:hypothetical protein
MSNNRITAARAREIALDSLYQAERERIEAADNEAGEQAMNEEEARCAQCGLWRETVEAIIDGRGLIKICRRCLNMLWKRPTPRTVREHLIEEALRE